MIPGTKKDGWAGLYNPPNFLFTAQNRKPGVPLMRLVAMDLLLNVQGKAMPTHRSAKAISSGKPWPPYYRPRVRNI